MPPTHSNGHDVHPPRSHRIEHELNELAARQHGIVRVGQLLAIGLSRSAISKRVTSGRLHRVHRGVYQVGPSMLSVAGRWLAGVFAVGDGAMLSGASAADLWGLLRTPCGLVVVTTPGCQRHIPGVVVRRTRWLPANECTTRRHIPVTVPARTIVDYALHADPYDTVGVLHEAAYRKLLDLVAVERIGARHCNQPGAWKLPFALAQHRAGSRGVLSRDERFLLGLYMEERMELPLANVLVDTPRGPYLVDQYWPRRRVVVELDGPGHRRLSARAGDVDRTAAMADAGLRLLRITSDRMYAEPAVVLRAVRALLSGSSASV